MKTISHALFSARSLVCMTLCLVSLMTVRAGQAVRKDSISVWGGVTDLFTGEQLEKGMLTVFNERDSIVVTDTIFGRKEEKFATYSYSVPGGYRFKLPCGGNYKIRFDIDGYVPEVQELRIPDRQYHKYTTMWKKDYKVRKKPKEHVLGEAVVTATRIKMVVKGDTVEYDADAFNVAEGSMLDKLLAEMPGMEIRNSGEIYHNGKKVESLLVDGKDFFDGDPKLALDNLPAYTVKKVKVYRKDGNGASVVRDSIKREEMKKLVIDVRLKKQYQKGWIANSDLAYGTSDRFSTRLALIYFSSVWKFMAYANLNNTNQAVTPNGSGDFWDGGVFGNGVCYSKQGGLRLMYDKDGLKGNVRLDGSHRSENNRTETSSTTYLNSGDTYSRMRSTTRNSSDRVDWGVTIERPDLDKFFLSFFPLGGSYSRTRGITDSNSATFSGDPRDSYRLASLDSLFMPMGSQRLERMRLNTVLNATQSLTRATALKSAAASFFRSPIYGNDMNVRYLVDYSDNRTENFQHYKLDNRQSQKKDFQNVFGLNPSKALTVEAAVGYGLQLGKKATTEFSYTYRYTSNKNNPDRYRLDSLPGWGDFDRHPMGTLPSMRDSLNLARDLRNSYSRTVTSSVHIPSLEFRLTLPKDWSLSLELPLRMEEHGITDTRTRNGQRKTVNLTALSPGLTLQKWSNDKTTGDVVNYRVYYNRTVSVPSMGYLLDLVDDTDPLFISRGNANLKNTCVNIANFSLWRTKSKHMQNYGANVAWSQTGNAVASTTTYDRSTGITTYRPRNINGNWNVSAGGNFSRAIDKKDRLVLREDLDAGYNHNVDYITETTGGVPIPLRSTVHNWTVHENLILSYSYKKFRVEATGGATWRMQNSSRDNFNRLNAVDFNYGIGSTGPLVAGIEYDTKLVVYSRRGYSEPSMNDNRVIWNMNISRAFLKSKALVLRIEAHDLLNQISNVENVVNAQGRTERWYNSVPRFALLHVCYKFNSMSKKKADKQKQE